MNTHWLATPFAATLLATICTLGVSGVILVFLSFGPFTARQARTFRGVVAPFLGVSTVILGILIGFLANDIWDRDRRARAAIRSEADSLVTLFTLVSTFNRPADEIAAAIRSYATVVTTKEWPAMAEGDAAPQAERSLDDLLRVVVRSVETPGSNQVLDRALLDTAIAIRGSRNTRLTLSRDESGPFKWIAVVVLSVLGQISIAVVHLEKLRPQILALAILSASLIFVIGVLAAHEVPFAPPFAVSSAPIAEVLELVPAAATTQAK
jgi:Protein of unknown function (DUF4239)